MHSERSNSPLFHPTPSFPATPTPNSDRLSSLPTELLSSILELSYSDAPNNPWDDQEAFSHIRFRTSLRLVCAGAGAKSLGWRRNSWREGSWRWSDCWRRSRRSQNDRRALGSSRWLRRAILGRRLALRIDGFSDYPSPLPLPSTSLEYFETEIPFAHENGIEHVTAILTSAQSTLTSFHVTSCKAPLVFPSNLTSTLFPRLVHFSCIVEKLVLQSTISSALQVLLSNLRIAETITLSWLACPSFSFLDHLPHLRVLYLLDVQFDLEKCAALGRELGRHHGVALRGEMRMEGRMPVSARIPDENGWSPREDSGIRSLVQALEGTVGSEAR